MARALLRSLVVAMTALAVLPLVASYRVGAIDFITAGRLLALVPGRLGIHLRRRWYRWTLDACGRDVIVEWMAVLKTPAIRVGDRVFIGSSSFVAESELKDDVMMGHGCVIQGGAHTHGFERTDVPMREQAGRITSVTIGPDVWIGAGARILADVAPGTVVGAGAVVTRSAPAHAVLAGVPARVLRIRGAGDRQPPVDVT